MISSMWVSRRPGYHGAYLFGHQAGGGIGQVRGAEIPREVTARVVGSMTMIVAHSRSTVPMSAPTDRCTADDDDRGAPLRHQRARDGADAGLHAATLQPNPRIALLQFPNRCLRQAMGVQLHRQGCAQTRLQRLESVRKLLRDSDSYVKHDESGEADSHQTNEADPVSQSSAKRHAQCRNADSQRRNPVDRCRAVTQLLGQMDRHVGQADVGGPVDCSAQPDGLQQCPWLPSENRADTPSPGVHFGRRWWRTPRCLRRLQQGRSPRSTPMV